MTLSKKMRAEVIEGGSRNREEPYLKIRRRQEAENYIKTERLRALRLGKEVVERD